MNKQIREVTLVSVLILAFSFLTLSAFTYVYRYYDIHVYKGILLILIIITAFAAFFTAGMTTAFYVTYKKRQAGPLLSKVLKYGLNILFPIAELIAGLINIEKDSIRNFYIQMNNIIVRSGGPRYDKDQIMVLLPHCLQNSECRHKVTNDIKNCLKCGKCAIGKLAQISEEKGIDIRVVTGGTVARNVISKCKPKLILSVACERDLSSGIADVRRIPVLGFTNERPNGPCYNTNINIEEFINTLDSVIKTESP